MATGRAVPSAPYRATQPARRAGQGDAAKLRRAFLNYAPLTSSVLVEEVEPYERQVMLFQSFSSPVSNKDSHWKLEQLEAAACASVNAGRRTRLLRTCLSSSTLVASSREPRCGGADPKPTKPTKPARVARLPWASRGTRSRPLKLLVPCLRKGLSMCERAS